MFPNVNLLNILLLCSGLLIPVPYLIAQRLPKWQMNETLKNVICYWLNFLFIIILFRVLIGSLLIVTPMELSGIAKFYPIRIAYPNYGLFQGLPFVIFCFVILAHIEQICNFISGHSFKYFILYVFSVILLLAVGGIHGGLIDGNIGIANATDHLADASLNRTLTDLFVTHTDRIVGLINPSYHAPHSSSHPAGSLAYWQIISHHVSPFIFSIINVLLFSLAFPVMYWALHKRFDHVITLQSVIACLFIPSMLIYGRSDDAVYYSLAVTVMAFIFVAVHEKKYVFTLLAGIFFIGAMNFSYASIVLLPAIFLFNANLTMTKSWQYIRRITPHILILLTIILIAIIMEMKITKFDWLAAFHASAQHNKDSNIFSLLAHGRYAEVINHRIMAVCDFLIFAGPLLLYLFISLFKNRRKTPSDWQIKNVALMLMLFVLVINSNGPGEISRPWGSLFLLIGFFWLPEFFIQKNQITRFLLIQAQFAWALILQVFLNFSW